MKPIELPTLTPAGPGALSPAETTLLADEVRALAEERNAVILAHNYQLPEVQDVADFVGDSLGLSRQAAATDAEVIAFCGVHFMAETASILSPEKTVLIPDLDAGCSLADSINADQLRAWKAEHPGARRRHVRQHLRRGQGRDRLLLHLRRTRSRSSSTSGREHGADTEILFGPDMWLGAFVERETGLTTTPSAAPASTSGTASATSTPASAPTTSPRSAPSIPSAEFLIHPECGCSTQAMEYVAVGRHRLRGRAHALDLRDARARRGAAPTASFIVATENGMLYPLQQAAPQANLIEANRMAFCKYMKMITLPKLRDALREMKLEVKVAAERSPSARGSRSSAWSRSARPPARRRGRRRSACGLRAGGRARRTGALAAQQRRGSRPRGVCTHDPAGRRRRVAPVLALVSEAGPGSWAGTDRPARGRLGDGPVSGRCSRATQGGRLRAALRRRALSLVDGGAPRRAAVGVRREWLACVIPAGGHPRPYVARPERRG